MYGAGSPSFGTGYYLAVIEALSLEMGFTYNVSFDEPLIQWWRLYAPKNEVSFDGTVGGTLDLMFSGDDYHACNEAASHYKAVECALNTQSAFLPTSNASNNLFGFPVVTTSTIPFHTSYQTGLVKMTRRRGGLWRLVSPFSGGLWGAIAGLVLTAMILMQLLSALHQRTAEPASSARDSVASVANLHRDVYYGNHEISDAI